MQEKHCFWTRPSDEESQASEDQGYYSEPDDGTGDDGNDPLETMIENMDR